jgi:hypothetical protein
VGDAVWRHNDGVAFVDSADRVVVLDLSLAEDEPRILSESGSAIWRAIDGRRSEGDIVAEIARQYEIAVDVVEPDVAAFVAELARLELIVRAQPSA